VGQCGGKKNWAGHGMAGWGTIAGQGTADGVRGRFRAGTDGGE
jgi:hypothetical protein